MMSPTWKNSLKSQSYWEPGLLPQSTEGQGWNSPHTCLTLEQYSPTQGMRSHLHDTLDGRAGKTQRQKIMGTWERNPSLGEDWSPSQQRSKHSSRISNCGRAPRLLQFPRNLTRNPIYREGATGKLLCNTGGSSFYLLGLWAQLTLPQRYPTTSLVKTDTREKVFLHLFKFLDWGGGTRTHERDKVPLEVRRGHWFVWS